MYNLDAYNSIFKVLGAVGIITALWYFTPILDLLEVFAVVVLIPLTFLAAVGVLSAGMFDTLVQVPAAIAATSARIKNHAEDLRNKQAQAA